MTTEQWALHEFLAAIDAATAELSDSLHTELMSDSKSAVYHVMRLAEGLTLPAVARQKTVGMTKQAFSHAVGPGEVYQRASLAIGDLENLRRYIGSLRRPE